MSMASSAKAQWTRCSIPINAHILMYAENNDFLDRPDALPLNLIWDFETTYSLFYALRFRFKFNFETSDL